MQVGPSGASSGAATGLCTIACACACDTSVHGSSCPVIAWLPLSALPGLSSLISRPPVPCSGRCTCDPVVTGSGGALATAAAVLEALAPSVAVVLEALAAIEAWGEDEL